MGITTESIGLTKNPFRVLNAQNYKSLDSFLASYSDALGEEVATVIGPNKTLMDTDYFPMNEFIGLHQMSVRWDSSISEGNGLIVEYYWKDKDGTEGSYPITAQWHADISDEFGSGVGQAYFHENHQYKVVIKSHPDIGDTDYVSLDYLKLEVADARKVTSQFTYAGNGGEVPAIQVLRAGSSVVTGNGTDYAYGVTIPLGATPQLYYLTVTANTNLKSYYAMVDSKNASSFKAWAVNKDGTLWSGAVSINWIAVCWEEVISLK